MQAWVAGVALAQGQPEKVPALPLHLEWEAPPGECPTREAIADEIRRLVGRPLVFDPAAEVVVSGTISRDGAGFVLELQTRVFGATERRTLRADACMALFDATALSVGVALEPFVAARGGQHGPPGGAAEEPNRDLVPEPGPAGQPPVHPEPGHSTVPEATQPEPEPIPAAGPDPHVDVGVALEAPAEVRTSPVRKGSAGARSQVGLFIGAAGPSFFDSTFMSGGVGPGVAWSGHRARAEVGLTYWVIQRAALEVDARAQVSAASMSARGCWQPRRGPWSFPICGGLEGGVHWGWAQGAAVERVESVLPSFGATLAGGADLRVAPWASLWLRAELLGMFVRPQFHLEGVDETIPVYSPSAVAVRVAFAVEFILPVGDGSRRAAVQ